ncbi:Bud site selection protein 5 [[Candida] zeylanoides]
MSSFSRPRVSTSSSVYSPLDSEFPPHARPLSSLESLEEEPHMPTEPSNQTFQSYVTAPDAVSAYSFGSINDSILNEPGVDRDDTIVDNDATPVIPQGRNDPIDETPVLGQAPFVEAGASLLPHQELSHKFKRLSMTIQQSNQLTSGESVQFIHSFQQNVERANDSSAPDGAANAAESRTSLYYRRIDEPTEDDASSRAATPPRSVTPPRSATPSQATPSRAASADGLGPPADDTSSSSSFRFGTTTSPTSSYVDLRGSRVSPQRAKTPDDLPIRKDLVRRFEELSPANELSDKQKNDLLVQAATTHAAGDAQGLNITDSMFDPRNASVDTTQESAAPVRYSTASSVTIDEEDLSTLFVRALHTFESSTLQSESDVSICLSFDKDDLAFVHTIDESGWGEVTLIATLQRGWIPMNYFAIAVGSGDDDDDEGRLPNSVYLKPLFHACGKFLMNPLSHRTHRGRYTFSVRVVNSIRDGVRILLQETDCLSRANEIVTKRPIVRKTRKSLLADWYNLMVKANEFKGTSSFGKIEVLTLMVYQVSRKAVAFLQVWSAESRQIVTRESERRLHGDMQTYPLLTTPPQARQRVAELNGLLYSYLGMIIGRLDLIEHNPAGCEILESLTHQIILLLRELLFISKTGSDFSAEKPADLDSSLDVLLGLVSDLVSGVKSLVVRTLNEGPATSGAPSADGAAGTATYYYTQEGGDLIQVASRMIKSISTTVASVRKLLHITGDFRLNAERAYPDYARMRIEPADLLRKCSLGIARAQSVKNRDLRRSQPARVGNANRYSIVRSGQTGALGLTANGNNLLHSVLEADVDGSPFSISNAEFAPFSNRDPDAPVSARHDINDELLVDSQGNLLGASFRGLVYTLTNEVSPPEYFFVSTFFICFRTFASGIDLIEELITRFEVATEPAAADLAGEVRLKNRRRLIAKMFQLWLESFWHEADHQLLTTLVNFFNECLAVHLPLDALKLIEVAARLAARPLIENQPRKPKPTKQLLSRSITITRLTRKNSVALSADTARYSMVDGYELSRINTNSSAQHSLASTMALPMPLGSASSSHTLLSKSQLSTIEKVLITYRAILGDAWCHPKYINARAAFVPLDLRHMLPNWYAICDQSWVLSSYRPNLLDFNGLEIAKQLTVVESQIFCSIRPDELLNANFSAKRAHLKLAPNVRQSLLFTNCLSGYVLESVLQPKIALKMRVNIVKTWLKVAISCLYLRNFNSLAAIITSLQSHLVTRLAKLWSELSAKYTELYDYLSRIVHPDKNYTVYRSKLRNFLVANDYNVPIVPYFSLFLQDLTFVMDGNPNYRKADSFLNQKLINIDKYLKITRIIADIESLQISYTADSPDASHRRNTIFSLSSNNKMEDYHIVAVPAMQELILLELWKVCQLNRKEEDRAWKLSCILHPRDAT